MRRRLAAINDAPIDERDRLFRWPLGPRPVDHPGITEVGLSAQSGPDPQELLRASSHPSGTEPVCLALNARAFSRLPQPAMLHQRRRWFLVRS